MGFSALYRARATQVNQDPKPDGSAGTIVAFIPTVFGEQPVQVSESIGSMPTSPEMGWVMFQAGNPEFPVWVGKLASAGLIGGGTDEVWVGTSDPGSGFELWYDTDAPAPSGSGSSGGTSDTGLWFANKQWYALGTSITADGSYATRLAAASGMLLNNRGQSGGSLSTASNGAIWSALTAVPATAEIITMETINDFRLNVPLGAVTDAENPATSYYGALRAAANWILTNRPGARTFFITAYGDAYVGYPNGKTTNSLGKYYWEYNDAMKRVGDVYGIPVIDVGRESGINYYTCTYFTNDLIHMNGLGGQRYSDYVWSKIQSLGWLLSAPTAAAPPIQVAVLGISIVEDNFALALGSSVQLNVAFSPSNATNKGVSWATSNASIISVSGVGQVTAVAAGSATITVTTTEGARTDSVVVTATVVHPSSVDVQPPTTRLLVATTQQLTATVFSTNSTNKAVTWASSATGIATVNSTGLVTAVALGNATITATTVDGGFTDTCAVLVSTTIPVTGVSLSPPTISTGKTGTQQLTPTISPSNATNTAVTYASSDPAVATVNSSGLVSGIDFGTCTITVTTVDSGFTATSTVSIIASEWVFQPQTTFRELNLNGLAASGSDPMYNSITVGSYGAIIINTPGHNAIEWTVGTGGGGGWLILGSQIGDDTTFIGMGDLGQTIANTRGIFTGGNVVTTPSAITPTPSNAGWAAGKVYRLGRSGNNIKFVRVDAGVETTLWQGTLSANFAGHETKFGQVDLGLLARDPINVTYVLPVNCRTGTWTP